MCVAGEEIGDVGSEKDRFESWQYRNVYARSAVVWDELRRIKSDEIGCDRQGREEELGSEGYEKEANVEDRDEELDWKAGYSHNHEPERGVDDVDEVDEVRQGEGVILQPPNSVSWVQRLVHSGNCGIKRSVYAVSCEDKTESRKHGG